MAASPNNTRLGESIDSSSTHDAFPNKWCTPGEAIDAFGSQASIMWLVFGTPDVMNENWQQGVKEPLLLRLEDVGKVSFFGDCYDTVMDDREGNIMHIFFVIMTKFFGASSIGTENIELEKS